MEAEHVDSLPFDVDGNRKFVISCDPENAMKSSKDGRPWQTWCTSRRSGHSNVRRRANCIGSWVCANPDCAFLKERKTANKVQFATSGGKKKCFVCENSADFVPCHATKVWEFNEDRTSVTIYHEGRHTCTAIPIKKNENVEKGLESAFKANQGLKPSSAANNALVNAMKEGKAWDEIDNIACTIADPKAIENIKNRSKKSDLGHSFEALAEFKAFCDKRDPFLVYKMNDERHNKEPSFVFKTSRFQADLGVAMDRDGDGLLSSQYCFVDAKHNRCNGFKTITLWVYHPMIRKLVKLATMETRKEDTDAMVKFWSNWNEVCNEI